MTVEAEGPENSSRLQKSWGTVELIGTHMQSVLIRSRSWGRCVVVNQAIANQSCEWRCGVEPRCRAAMAGLEPDERISRWLDSRSRGMDRRTGGWHLSRLWQQWGSNQAKYGPEFSADAHTRWPTDVSKGVVAISGLGDRHCMVSRWETYSPLWSGVSSRFLGLVFTM